VVVFILCSLPVLSRGQAVNGVRQTSDGSVDVSTAEGTLRIRPLTENAVRIRFYTEADTTTPELIFTSGATAPKFIVSDAQGTMVIAGKKIVISVDKKMGTLSFADRSGKVFLREKTGTRQLSPSTVNGEQCFVAEQSFESPADEHILGLGQFQDGYYNLRNVTRHLTQVNSQIAIPFLYSNKGYGLLWHQYGLTDFNPADNAIALEKQAQDAAGNTQAAEVTTTSGTQKVSQHQSLYNGKFSVPQDGEYSIFLDLGDMGNRHYVVVDGIPLIDETNFWLPPTASALTHLHAGEHHVQTVCKSTNTPAVSWTRADDATTFRSPAARELDYVVFYGPSADTVIATYRNLSGNVPMLPEWAFGFWQCRERYTSGKHLVETVKEFRDRNIPMDVIVQDWQYWGKYGWGVMKFDEDHYPNPAGFIKELHEMHARFNISVWENLNKDSEIGKDYVAKKLFIPESPWLDALNPLARQTHWDALNTNLFAYGVDSWWMDATEPENDALKGKRTFLGLGDFYRLTYPLFVSQAVYEGQRKTTADKRVVILTRSAFLGQQRYGTINWSGDINGTWDSYKRQIVAGLNYTMTGMPFWTTDIGGFFRPGPSQYTDEKYHELLTRWYQWGAFNPIFRVHGYQSETEPWKYGPRVEANMRKMLDLRYRLLPYMYSEAWQVTKHGSTMMRPLVMDFKDDTMALKQRYEYMFGKAVLTAPVTEPGVDEWNVYLPQSSAWYDFWTGKRFDGGRHITTPAPLDKIPLYVKAGSIIPMGKFLQYSGEKSQDTLELRVYPGADGHFELYEDEGDNYNYESGKYSLIGMQWNDKQRTLTLTKRQGNYPGMVKDRTLYIIVADANKGIGIEFSDHPNTIITFRGEKMAVHVGK
jgi:alpha-D-xyloside xylohydrolase